MLRRLTTGEAIPTHRSTSYIGGLFAAFWPCACLLIGHHASADDLVFDALTRGDERILGRPAGDTPDDLRFVKPDGAALPLDRIQSMDLPISPRTLPDRGWKRVRLRNGDVLHAKVASPPEPPVGQQSVPVVKWLTGFGSTTDLPLSDVAALSHPAGTRCLVYQDFEGETTGWKDPAGAEIIPNAEQARSGALSLKCSPSHPKFRYDLAQPLSKGWVEFAFFLDPTVEPQGNCTATLKLSRGQEPFEIQIGLSGAQRWYELQLPGEVQWQRQNVPRRSGWHVVRVRWRSDEIQVVLDGFPLAEADFKTTTALQLAGIELTSSLKSGAVWIDDFALDEPVTESPGALVQIDSDQLDLVSGDQLFGNLRGLDGQHVQFAAGAVDSQIHWGEIRHLHLAARPAPARSVSGYMVRIHLQPWSHAPTLRDADSIRGALLSVDQKSCQLEHPIGGRFSIPWTDIRRLQIQYRGQEWVLDGRGRHLGNEVKSAFTMPVPEGTRLNWSLDLDTVPTGAAYVALTTSDLEPGATGTLPHRWLDQLRMGHLTSELWVNDRRVAILNQEVSSRGTADQPRRLRIRLPDNSLIVGKNRLAIHLQPSVGEPIEYDDWELHDLRLEVERIR